MGNLEEFEAHLRKFRGAEPPPGLVGRLVRARVTKRIAVVAALAAAVAVIAALGFVYSGHEEAPPPQAICAPPPESDPPHVAPAPRPEPFDYASLRSAAARDPEALDLALARAAGRIFPEPAKPVSPGSSWIE